MKIRLRRPIRDEILPEPPPEPTPVRKPVPKKEPLRDFAPGIEEILNEGMDPLKSVLSPEREEKIEIDRLNELLRMYSTRNRGYARISPGQWLYENGVRVSNLRIR